MPFNGRITGCNVISIHVSLFQGRPRAKLPAAGDFQRQHSPRVSLQHFQSGSYQVPQRLLDKWILCPQFPWLVSPSNEKCCRRSAMHIVKRGSKYIQSMGFNLFLYTKEAWLLLLMTSRYFRRLEESKIEASFGLFDISVSMQACVEQHRKIGVWKWISLSSKLPTFIPEQVWHICEL